MYNSGKLEAIFNLEGNQSTYIICEIGINHNGSLDTALELIIEAKKARVDAVKFQKRNLEKIYSKSILSDSNSEEWNFEYLIPLLRECELTENDYKIIRSKCDELQIDLIITPFDEVSAEFIASLGVTAFKISSADMTNFNLINKCSTFSVPIIISTGMWDEEDIKICVEYYKKENVKFALLHAQSTYPAPYESLNLGFIENLKRYSDIVGYSGHERGNFIPIAMVALGCKIIEKHITFDQNQKGPDHKASMLPREWLEMVQNIRNLEKSMDNKKTVNQAEKLNREVFAKSAVALKKLPEGHILKSEDIEFKSPGKGIFQHEIKNYFGKVLKGKIDEANFISKTDFEEVIEVSNWNKFEFLKDWGVKCRFHDFQDYIQVNSPVLEFHCSQTDLDYKFNFINKYENTQLIVHAPEIFDRELVDICSKDPSKVERSLNILQRSIDKTLEIAPYFSKKKPKLVAHLGGMSLNIQESIKYEEMLDIAIKNFARLDIPNNKIDFLPENLPHRPWYFGGQWFQYGFTRAEDMSAFCNHFGIGMTYDICHAYLYCKAFNEDIIEYTKKVLPLAYHLHISDAEGISGEGLQIGEGEINLEEVFAELKDSHFSWVSEIWSGHLHNGTGTYKALRLLEKYKEL